MVQYEDGSGTAPSTGGGSGAAADIEITFADVEKIGHDTAGLAAEASAAKASLGDARGHSAAFGSYPPAKGLYAHHQAVVGVFEETLTAMTTDLENFGSTIVQASHAHEQNDADTLATLSSLASKLDSSTLKDKYIDARNQQGDKLTDVKIDNPDAMAEELPDLDQSVLDAVDEAHTDDDAVNEGDDGSSPENKSFETGSNP